MTIYIRIRGNDQILQSGVLSCNDQILQIHCAIKGLILCYHKNGRNIVILSCLFYQTAHSLLYGQIFADHNTVCGHPATDLVFIEGCDHGNIFFCVIIQKFCKKRAFFFGSHFQNIHNSVCFHSRKDSSSFLYVHFIQIFRCLFLVDMLENIRKHICIKDTADLAPFS